MQAFPYIAGPMSAGTGTVPGVSYVGAPQQPFGVSPSVTQQPMAPMTGFPPQPQGFAPTYPGAAGPLPYRPMPGPAALGPSEAPIGGTGNVAGVSIAPITTVAPPVTSGGPHPLPSIPQVPLPQGFPNPFAIGQLGPAGPTGPAPMQGPGSMVTTGPQGYLPGLGYFGSPGMGTGFSMPGPVAGGVAGPDAMAWQPAPSPPPNAFPVLPGSVTQPAAPAPAVNPFWLHLAWQLVQAPPVGAALGERFQSVMQGDRNQVLNVAAGCLLGPELQAAFRGLVDHSVTQAQFTELFAERFKRELQSAGLITAGS